jgi:hypothetical protein
MKFNLCAARLIPRSAFLAVLLCSAVTVYAQVPADPSVNGAAVDIAMPNPSADPDASQGVFSGSGAGRSLLRQQAAADSRLTSFRAPSLAYRFSQQKQASLYTASSTVPGAVTSTNSAPRSTYGGTGTPAIRPLRFKPAVGGSLGMGLSSGFSTGTILGGSQAGSVGSSSSASTSASRSPRKRPPGASSASSLRGTSVYGIQSKSRLERLSEKYTFQPPRSRYSKEAPESSFRGRLLSDRP